MKVHRRSMLGVVFGSALGLGLAALGAVAALWTVAIARFMSPNVANQPSNTFRAGLPSDYSEDRVETKYRLSRGVWIVRLRTGEEITVALPKGTVPFSSDKNWDSPPLIDSPALSQRGRPRICALRTTCTHLGCVTLWQESQQKFLCPCHGSGFTKEGINIEGPATRPLERCAIRIADDGQIEIDRSRTFQEQLGEWDDPESYIVV
jgi:cytochrome b6-f complex iron-sulfur subunit